MSKKEPTDDLHIAPEAMGVSQKDWDILGGWDDDPATQLRRVAAGVADATPENLMRLADKIDNREIRAKALKMAATVEVAKMLHDEDTKTRRIIIDVTGGVAEIVDSEGWPQGLELFIVDRDCGDMGASRPHMVEGQMVEIRKFEAGDRANDTGHYAKTVAEEWANG